MQGSMEETMIESRGFFHLLNSLNLLGITTYSLMSSNSLAAE